MTKLGFRQQGKLLLLAGLVLMACGCTKSDDPYETYLERLQNLLGDAAPVSTPQLPTLPRTRALVIDQATDTINLFDFAKLHRCDLGELASRRQGPLGQVMVPSQQLGLDLRWVRQGGDCVKQGENWLQPIVERKRRGLSQVFWNATVAGPEFAAFNSLAGHKVAGESAPGYLAGTDQLLLALLDHYRALRAHTLDVSALEITLGQLKQNAGLGQVRKRWQHRRAKLDQVSDLLTRAGTQVCRNGKTTPTATRAQRVFEKFYVASVQPQMAQQQALELRVVELMNALHTELIEVVVPAFGQWFVVVWSLQHPDSEWGRTRVAVREHAAAWQQFWGQCGMDPLQSKG